MLCLSACICKYLERVRATILRKCETEIEKRENEKKNERERYGNANGKWMFVKR